MTARAAVRPSSPPSRRRRAPIEAGTDRVRGARGSGGRARRRSRRAAARRGRSGDAGRQRQSARDRRARQRLDADVLLVFNDLRPRQRTNLEKIVPLPIVDRTMLILDIFAQHARTREGQAASRARAAALPAVQPDRRRRAISRAWAAASGRAAPAKRSSRSTGARSRRA